MNAPKHIWNAQTTNRGSAHEQGLIIDETTGDSIAVCYDPRHAPLICAAPELLDSAKTSAAELDGAASMLCSGDSFNPEELGEALAGLAMAIRSVVAKAEGSAQ